MPGRIASGSATRVLGIDPGSRLTGFGLVDLGSRDPVYVASGTVRSLQGDFPERLRQIFEAITVIVDEYSPDVVAIESVFMHRNAGSALKLGQARSAALCATFGQQMEVHEYAPREIKQAVVGTGAASKEQVQLMVASLLGLNERPAPDAADALAAAICHGHQRKLRERLRQHGPLARAR